MLFMVDLSADGPVIQLVCKLIKECSIAETNHVLVIMN